MKTNGITQLLAGVIAIIFLSASAVIAIKFFPAPFKQIAKEEIAQEESLYSSTTSKTEETEMHSRSNIDTYMSEIRARNSSLPLDTNNREDAPDRYKKEALIKVVQGERQQYQRLASASSQGFEAPPSGANYERPHNDSNIRYNTQDDRYEVDISESDSPSYEDTYEETISSDLNVLVSRDVVSGGLDGEIDVILTVYIDGNAPNGLILKEFIPNGWQVLASEPQHNNYNASSGQIKWLFMGSDVNSMKIRYTVTRRDVFAGDLSLHGTYMYNDPEEGNRSMNIESVNEI